MDVDSLGQGTGPSVLFPTVPFPSVLHEDAAFVAIDKPAGIGMHDEEGVPGIITRLRDALSNPLLFPVHRLDKETSGVLLVGKGKPATAALSALFEQRLVSKYYWALSDKKPSKKQGSIKGDMARARNGSWKLMRTHNKPALTQFFSFGLGDGNRAFLCKPLGGKTHQIRVALKSLGAAILGDQRYGGGESDRMYLHATRLSFQLNDVQYDIESRPNVGAHFTIPAFNLLYQSLGHPSAQPWPEPKNHA